jgi:hypothetical protein
MGFERNFQVRILAKQFISIKNKNKNNYSTISTKLTNKVSYPNSDLVSIIQDKEKRTISTIQINSSQFSIEAKS